MAQPPDLVAKDEIESLKARYFRSLDAKAWSDFRSLFTDDVHCDVSGVVTEGGDRFVSWVESRISEAKTVHHGHTPLINLTSDTTATGVWAMFDYVEFPPGNPRGSIHGYGHYVEEYRKEKGIWLICSLELTRLRVDNSPAAELAAIRERVRCLEDERAVLDTLYAYGHSIDYGREDDWLDCFTDDAVYDLRYRLGHGSGGDPAERTYRGRSDLAEFIANHTRAPGRWHKHLLCEPRVTLDRDRATSASYFVRVDHEGGQRKIWAFGRYLDTLVRCPDGHWRIEERIVEIESR